MTSESKRRLNEVGGPYSFPYDTSCRWRRVVAFDPGTVGGVFCELFLHNGQVQARWDTLPLTSKGRVDYEILHILDCLDGLAYTRFVIEDVWVMPKQGVVSSAKFIEAYAAVKALMAQRADAPTCELVGYRPQDWKKKWNLTKEKQSSCTLTATAFPSLKDSLLQYSPKTGRKLKNLNHNRADAFLLAMTTLKFG
jgi:hypothetical protein